MNYSKGSVTGYNVQAKSIGSDKLSDDVAGGILNQVRDIIPEYADPTASRPATVSVTDSDPTLSWGPRSKVGTVQGTDLHVTMPSNPATRQAVYSSGNVIAEKSGNVVVYRSIADAASSTDIRNTVIPEGSRPAENVGIPIMIYKSGTGYNIDGKHLLIKKNGGVSIVDASGNVDTQSSFSYSVFNGCWCV